MKNPVSTSINKHPRQLKEFFLSARVESSAFYTNNFSPSCHANIEY